MQILLTGGSSDLGTILNPILLEQGHHPLNLDIRPPQVEAGHFIQGSILDRDLLGQIMPEVDCVVHIAAWHGVHEVRQQKDAYDFWDLNVTGTFNVFEAAARADVKKFIYISSTSVREQTGIYGHTKVLGEEIARTYHARHGMNVITLRPRAFIPHWNTDVYANYLEWVEWFWGGAVHIDDVAQAVHQSINLLARQNMDEHLILTLDRTYEYTADDLANWDAEGVGSSFRKYYAPYYEQVVALGLDPSRKPSVYDISATQHWLGYRPTYNLRQLLDDLVDRGAELRQDFEDKD